MRDAALTHVRIAPRGWRVWAALICAAAVATMFAAAATVALGGGVAADRENAEISDAARLPDHAPARLTQGGVAPGAAIAWTTTWTTTWAITWAIT